MKRLVPNKEKKILSELLYNEERELRSLVQKVKQLFEIDENGNPIWKINFSKSSIKEKIVLVLSAAFFAKKLGKLGDDSFSVSELEKRTGVVMTSLSGSLKHMGENGWIVKSGQKYHITTYGIKWVLDQKLSGEKIE